LKLIEFLPKKARTKMIVLTAGGGEGGVGGGGGVGEESGSGWRQ